MSCVFAAKKDGFGPKADTKITWDHYIIKGTESVQTIYQSELLVPVLVYSVTYITGLIGNILILVAVTGQKQVGEGTSFSKKRK